MAMMSRTAMTVCVGVSLCALGAGCANFMESRKEEFTMYAVTLPGFGGTPALPMPPEGTSYGEQTWTRSAITGLSDLIRDEEIEAPIVVAHWINASGIARVARAASTKS